MLDEQPEDLLLEVSAHMVHLFKQQFGRGPASARAYWAGPDVLVCVLEGTLTPAERSLVTLGEHQRLRETRIIFQYGSVEDFCAPIEALTGRKVRAFHSSTDTAADGQSLEVFVLYPVGHDGPSRIDLEAA